MDYLFAFIPEIANVCLYIAFSLAIVLISKLFFAAPKLDLSDNIINAKFGLVLISFFGLGACFLVNDFSVEYVAQNSNTNLPIFYKICAIWGAHEGSLLLWLVILAFWGWVLNKVIVKDNITYYNAVFSIYGFICAAFLGFIIYTSSPFLRILPYIPANGMDLNPLLQDPIFAIHPPVLYLGYVGLCIPFILVIANLLVKNNNIDWLKLSAPFILTSWAALTIGIMLGSYWAYYELGWGGYWFWDPVENASLIPWLVATSLVHVCIIAKQNRIFYKFAQILAVLGFCLSLLGTFLVRSGVLSSVHSFAASPKRGLYILALLAIVVAISILAFFKDNDNFKPKINWSNLSSRAKLQSFGIFSMGLLFLAAALITIIGTIYPLVMQAIFNIDITVGAPYFNLTVLPVIFLAAILLWFVPYLKYKIKYFILLSAIFTVILIFKFNVLLVLGASIASIIIILGFYKLITNFNKIGSNISHIGFGLVILGITVSSFYSTEKDIIFKFNEPVKINHNIFILQDIIDTKGANYSGVKAEFLVKPVSGKSFYMYPEKRYFTFREIVMTETAIRGSIFKDYYLALGEPLENGSQWSAKVHLKIMVRLIWIGGILIAMGAFIASLPKWRALKNYKI